MNVHGDQYGWREPSRGEHFRRCEYCGSIHPEDLVKEQFVAEWADRKYGYPHKFYVSIPSKNPEVLVPMGTGPVDTYPSWTNGEDLSDEQKALLVEHGYGKSNPNRSYLFASRETHFAKFYTEHLKDPDLSLQVKNEIFKRSGLIVVFDSNGYVRWTPYPYGE